MTNKFAHLTIDGKNNWSIDLPILTGTEGPEVIDISSLAKEGYFTYDPGFISTASCESQITYIDGDHGILRHCGFPIEQLAEQSDFLETCFLLLHGELPTTTEKETFTKNIFEHATIHEQMVRLLKGFRRDAHPMAILCGMSGALASFYHDTLDISSEEQRELIACHLISKMATLAAMAYKYSIGEQFMYPRRDLSYGGNFLHMLFATPNNDYKPSKILSEAMDRILLLHADHEQNASTSTVRLAGSSGANPFACIAAGIAALWGPAHGGANEAVLKMLDEIQDESCIEKFIARAKDKNDPFRLMGFGHRVYKNIDPRAKVMKLTCDAVLSELGIGDDPIFKIAKKLETIALEDSYFIDRKLYPNVDFYSGIILKALGIPVQMFTAIFAVGRTPGWIAHWHEMIGGSYRIGRPRQLYTGSKARDFVKINKR